PSCRRRHPARRRGEPLLRIPSLSDRGPPATAARAPALREDVVVAGGGLVQGDLGHDQVERPQAVDAAADALAVAAARPGGPAVGLVEQHRAAVEREARRGEWAEGGAVEDAPAQAVAAGAARR